MSIPREHFTAVSAHKILARRIWVTILSRHLFPRQQANRRQIFQIPFRPVAILPRERERERRKKGRKIDPHLASSTRKFVLAFLPRNDTAIFGPRNENEETLHFFTPPPAKFFIMRVTRKYNSLKSEKTTQVLTSTRITRFTVKVTETTLRFSSGKQSKKYEKMGNMYISNGFLRLLFAPLSSSISPTPSFTALPSGGGRSGERKSTAIKNR